ncbi:MAG: phospholipase D-like domain-containing protein [Candidatus Cryptobacteroides sp.]
MPQFTRYIADSAHYNDVISRIAGVRKSLWIGTADIKDLYVNNGGETVPLLEVLAGLVKRGVEIRLIYAKQPGPAFREDHDKYPVLFTGMERLLCPRVHFKLIVFDCETAYIGSANLTGAGIGMKSDRRRNFEAGILTNDPSLVEAAIDQFDKVWMGAHCKTCGRKQFCTDGAANGL